MYLVFALCTLVAVVAFAIRLVRERSRERNRPGRAPARAIEIGDYGDIDAAVRREACPCGGSFELRGEGPVSGHPRPVRVARIECRSCGRERRLYFDLGAVHRRE